MYKSQQLQLFLNKNFDTALRYMSLTKPKIIVLLSITGIVGYILPNPQAFGFTHLLVFLLVGIGSSGGAMSINNIIDRDIDLMMARTRKRPSTGKEAIPPQNIAIFGSGLVVLSVIGAYLYFGKFTAFYLAWGALFYIFGYSILLKRRTVWNTVIGGLASPAPVWAGFAASYEIVGIRPENSFLGVPAIGWLLGILVFIWTPSHTWALAAKNMDDYALAGVPMLPVLVGIEKTALYTLLGGVITLIFGNYLLLVVTGNILVLLLALVPNWVFVKSLLTFVREPTKETATSCFKKHNIWLGIVFILALVV